MSFNLFSLSSTFGFRTGTIITEDLESKEYTLHLDYGPSTTPIFATEISPRRTSSTTKTINDRPTGRYSVRRRGLSSKKIRKEIPNFSTTYRIVSQTVRALCLIADTIK